MDKKHNPVMNTIKMALITKGKADEPPVFPITLPSQTGWVLRRLFCYFFYYIALQNKVGRRTFFFNFKQSAIFLQKYSLIKKIEYFFLVVAIKTFGSGGFHIWQVGEFFAIFYSGHTAFRKRLG